LPEKSKVFLVVNPRAGGRFVEKNWPTIESGLRTVLDASFEHEFTEHRNHATEVSRRALREGFETIVAVGGDGTINEVVNGFFEAEKPVNPEAVLGILAAGTGSDLARTLNLPDDLESALRRLIGKEARTIDVGTAEFATTEGAMLKRYFINIANFGLVGDVMKRVNRSSKPFGGNLTYQWSTIVSLARHKSRRVSVQIEDRAPAELSLLNFIVANGAFFGSGMKCAPNARIDDGLFETIQIGDLGFFQALTNLRKFTKGEYLTHPKVEYGRARSVSATSDEEVPVEMDGEVVGLLPAAFRITPGAIKVRA